MKSPITTHVLDTTKGKPASDVPVILEKREKSGEWKAMANRRTDSDGRVADLLSQDHRLEEASYRLIFDTGTYFVTQGVKSMFLSVVIPFEVNDTKEHYHIPLLLSPFGYSTYRGS